jgi:precorrin-6B methylase 1
MRALVGFDVHIHPGLSSVQLAAAYACINLDESAIITLASPDLSPSPMAKWLMQQGTPRSTMCWSALC